MRFIFPNKVIKVRINKDKDTILQAQMSIELVDKTIHQEIDLINSKFGTPLRRSTINNFNKDALLISNSTRKDSNKITSTIKNDDQDNDKYSIVSS